MLERAPFFNFILVDYDSDVLWNTISSRCFAGSKFATKDASFLAHRYLRSTSTLSRTPATALSTSRVRNKSPFFVRVSADDLGNISCR